MKSATPELMKFKRLQRMLKDTRRGTIGLLEGMWIAVAKNCPGGDIGQFTNEEIAIMVDWEGDPDDLVDALVACRWLDESADYRLIVHDWDDHCPRWVKANLSKYGKEMAKDAPKEPPKSTTQPPKEPPKEPTSVGDVGCTEEPPPLLTIPNHSPPPPPDDATSGGGGGGIDWQTIDGLLQRHGMGERFRVLDAVKASGSSPSKVLQVIGAWEERRYLFTNPTGALHRRLMNEAPGLAADSGWVVDVRPKSRGQPAKDANLDYECKRAELVKSMRRQGKSEDEIEAAEKKLYAKLQGA